MVGNFYEILYINQYEIFKMDCSLIFESEKTVTSKFQHVYRIALILCYSNY